MSSIRTVWLVAVRELTERVRSKAFLFSTGFVVLLVGGVIIIPQLLDSGEPNDFLVATSIEVPDTVVEQFEAVTGGNPGLRLEPRPTADEVREAVELGEVDAGLVAGPELIIKSGDPNANVQLLASTLATASLIGGLEDLGVTAEELVPLLQSGVAVTPLEESPAEEDTALGFLAVILLYVTILSYGQWVVLGVIEEKSSRVVEVVLGAMEPRQLLAGKVLGIGALGVGQLILIGVIALLAASVGDRIELPDATATAVGAVLMWFILGFGIYGVMFAAAGALASRQEDAGNATFPFTILLTIGYLVSFTAVEETNIVVRVLSYLPPFAPISMQLRMVNGDAALWEVLLSVGLAVVAIYAIIRLGERFYRGAILGQGTKMKWREAWRSAAA